MIYFKGMGMIGNGAHDPFRIIIKGCLAQCGIPITIEEDRIFDHSSACQYNCVCITTDESTQAFLESFRPYIRELRKKYKGESVCVDYADENFRRAYMLAYYPFYINPICQTLESCNFVEIIGEKENLHTCCFGGGPLPELLGIGKYINSYMPGTWCINCTVFDYYEEWTHERQLHTLNLIGHYYSGLPNLFEKSFDLWSGRLQVPDEVKNSDLVVFQNCFNDCPTEKYGILKNNVRAIWENMPRNSLMVIIDLDYSATIDLIRQIEAMIAAAGGNILLPAKINDCPLRNCQLLIERLYDGTDGLIPRYHSWYWSLAVVKNRD